jgi:hypothetical protein
MQPSAIRRFLTTVCRPGTPYNLYISLESPVLDATAMPEPASITLLGLAVLCLAGRAWHRRKQAAMVTAP